MPDAQQIVIRNAVEADAPAIGRLHVRAWQHAYRGVMPDEYLDGLRPEDRAAMWRGRINRRDLPSVLVAATSDEVVGFAAFGAPQRPPSSTTCGELHAINLDPDHWGKGIGRTLLRAATVALAGEGYEEAVLWVVPENTRARRLYESEGWTADGAASTEEILGVTVTDVRYRMSLAASPPSA